VTGAALALVLPSAAAHATWNMLAKRSDGGLVFVWLGGVLGLVPLTCAALVVVAIGDAGLSAAAVGWMAGSAAIHAVYFLTLQRGYRSADLSVVYPLARGTGPLLAFVAAIVLLDESPDALQVLGAAAIVGSVLSLGLHGARRSGDQRAGAAYALVTGVLIAGYTLWDKHGVDGIDTNPVIYLLGVEIARATLVAPLALRRGRDAIAREWRANGDELRGFAILAPLSYVLFLSALALAPVTLVAPLRELSILIGVALGGQLLAEEDTPMRAVAAVAMVFGVVAISVG
jgi:drug/metabolite transporter (DMT)-like permease